MVVPNLGFIHGSYFFELSLSLSLVRTKLCRIFSEHFLGLGCSFYLFDKKV